jgi:electron transport complex protein RnfA
VITKRLPFSTRQQGLLLFLTGGNSAVLGATLLSSTSVLSLGENIAYSFGAALGYSLMIVGFAALRIRLEFADVPAPFRGSSIQLITAGLVAISLLGFAGMT